MAAAKHSLVDEASDSIRRPSKKSKSEVVDPEDTTRLKKEKERRDKKKAKTDRKAEEKKKKNKKKNDELEREDGVNNSEAEKKAAKKLRKAEKKAKHRLERAESSQEDPAAAPAPIPITNRQPSKSANNYLPVYSQTLSLSSVSQSAIDDFLTTNEVVLSDPKGPITLRPVVEFHHLPSTNLLEKKPSPFAGYKEPTPIQAASWPFTLSGRDAIGVAETGSGKTMAFALPCVEAVLGMVKDNKKKKAVKAVIVSPTRELAMQTHEQMDRLAKLVGLKCVCLYGGASKDDQRALLQRGSDIIIATPGRLKDFMSDETVRLENVGFAVLDEADRMLDKGFEEDIKLILGACPAREQRQTLMFTATWPQSVQALASTFMVSPVRITIGSGGKETASGAVELQANTRISQKVEVVDPRDKESRLLHILREHQQGNKKNDRILVFCLYKKEATRVEAFLKRKGIKVGGIHGDLKQEQRTRSLEAFKKGETPVLVATDVAARGLDIPEVKLVVNVTFPLTIEDYVHRIGRTGRAGKTGHAITMFTTQDKAHSGSLINILKGANQPVPEDLMKFGTTVKKKQHDIYGSFFKDVDMTQKATKITFD